MLARIVKLFNTRLYKAVDSLETPEDLLQGSLNEMENNLVTVNRALLDLTSAREKLKMELEDLENKNNLHREQAKAALTANREDLAKEVLEKTEKSNEHKQVLEQQLTDLETQIASVKDSRNNLAQNIQELKRKKVELLALNDVAEARLLVKESIAGIDKNRNSVADQILRAEEKIKQKQARVKAIGSLTDQGVLQPVLDAESECDREIKELVRQQKIAAELNRLKEELA
ncbi:MAG: hypothetical protein CVU89_14540 [Firmicutes bacterium HGW-Firmicutes-14]|jgi:phage shock protein A|nr:MAG: hypothetical protein CVU89_14540 [Firmicutes bacterium HGW-Firmicutes-14]